MGNSPSTAVVRYEPNPTTTTNLRPMNSFTDVSVGGRDLFRGLFDMCGRAVYVAVDTCKSILSDPEPKPKAPPKAPTKIYRNQKSYSVEEINEQLKAYLYPLWEEVKSIKAECKQLRDDLESLKQQSKRCNTCKEKLDETEPHIVGLEVEATDSLIVQTSDNTTDNTGTKVIDWSSITNASPDLMDQPRIDKFEELFSEIEGFVLDNIPQSDVLGFGAEKISKDCDAWEECTKALWVQSVIADTIHRELFEDEEIESSDVAVKKPPPESVISTLSTTLSEMLCCADKPAGATQALHLSQKAYACAYILQTSQTRYTWAQNPGQTKVRGNSARVRAVLAGGKIEGGKLYEVAFTVFGALIKYYGENGEEQVEINKARVVARDSLED